MTRLIPILLALTVVVSGCARTGPGLLVYCGGSMRPPVEELAGVFQRETGTPVRITFGDSGTLLVQIRQTGRGDVLVCHDPFAAMAENDGLVTGAVTLARLVPVIAVPKDNPKEINSLTDFTREGLRLGLPDADYSTAGSLLKAMLNHAGLSQQVAPRVVLRQRSSADLANALVLGHVDAVVCWDAVARQHADNLKVIDIEPRFFVDTVTSATARTYPARVVNVTASVLGVSAGPDAAERFLGLLCSDQGRRCFSRHGFTLTHKEQS